jgi:hypothetical protein
LILDREVSEREFTHLLTAMGEQSKFNGMYQAKDPNSYKVAFVNIIRMLLA